MANTIQAIPNHPQAQEIMDLIACSISLRQEKRHEEALRRLEEAIGIDPKFFPVFVEKGIVLFELARYEESIECFDLFLKYISNSQVRELRDNCLRHALTNYDRIVAESTANAEVLLKRGDILQRLHRHDHAVHNYDMALDICVINIVNILNRRGNSLLDLNRPEDALECYNRAMELAPRDASYGSLLFNRANVLQQIARID